MVDDGRTTEHGYTISSPCEPDGSGELKTHFFAIKTNIRNGMQFLCDMDELRPQGYKLFSCSTQLRLKFILLINV